MRIAFCTLLLASLHSLGPVAGARAAPVAVVFDSDMGPDVDDAAALGLLHALADRGEAVILAEMLSSTSPTGAASMSAINAHYGRPNIPIGVFKSKATFFHASGPYEKMVAATAPPITHNGGQPDAVALYRQVLARQPDRSVVVVSVGFLNNLMGLLASAPDAASPLEGVRLVERKVLRLVAMGGRYPSSRVQPKPEFNFGYEWGKGDATTTRLAARASSFVVSRWPTPILFSGVEIGSPIKTGSNLSTATPATNPIRMVYEAFGGPGKPRESWDLTAVLAAVRGISPYWRAQTVGRNVVHPDGHNDWEDAPDAAHSYLVQKMPPAELARILDELLATPPVRGGNPGDASSARAPRP